MVDENKLTEVPYSCFYSEFLLSEVKSRCIYMYIFSYICIYRVGRNKGNIDS